jgi:hypothetical protein
MTVFTNFAKNSVSFGRTSHRAMLSYRNSNKEMLDTILSKVDEGIANK